jgi:NTP pyrophosphatase (non-canonical NTP hydrolase)
MLDPEGGVTPEEQEILVRIMEESGELIQAVSKVLRWGWRSFNPELPISARTFNYEAVRREHDDLMRQFGRLGELRTFDLSEPAPHITPRPEREGSRR